ncbi:tetratricopeptide repeat protein, partial [Zoogloea sp.]|uniref:tetratricopeptide repeat protein n=1 Tax=Zoogloea sp. TaxID=49181 RepID=UPI0025F05BBA
GRADYQRNLSVSYIKLGDLMKALGEGEAARRYYEDSLAIRQRLVQAEPGRADYQRDLSVSYERLGDLLGALGEGEAARRYYEDSLEIAQCLAQAEPVRADYQRDVVVSLIRIAAMDSTQAAALLQEALSILRALKAGACEIPDLDSMIEYCERRLADKGL